MRRRRAAERRGQPILRYDTATAFDGEQCLCGALAETGRSQCAKCRARARWTRRKRSSRRLEDES